MDKLVIVYPKAIGDFIFLLPALHTLRKALPDTHLTLVVKQKQAPLALPQKGFLADEVWTLGGQTGWNTLRRRLSGLKPDLIADMAGNDQSGLLLAWRRGRRLRPHPADCKGYGALYSARAESFARLDPGLHRVDELLRYARRIVPADPVFSFRLRIPDAAVEASENAIARYGLRDGSVIALNVGASRSSKRWPARHFRTLAEGLVAEGHRVVFTGAREFRADGHHDAGVANDFIQAGLIDGERFVNLITEGEWPPALHLQRDTHFLRYSGVPRVVVGCDTGPLHIAGSVGDDARRKTVSLFGPTSGGRYAPYDPTRSYPDRPAGQWNRVLHADLPCRPSGHEEACARYRRGCPTDACMADLSPDSVLTAVLALV